MTETRAKPSLSMWIRGNIGLITPLPYESEAPLSIGLIILSERRCFSLAFMVQKRYLCTSVSKDGSNDIV